MPFPGAEQLLTSAIGGNFTSPVQSLFGEEPGSVLSGGEFGDFDAPFNNNSGDFGDVIINQASDDARIDSNPVTGARGAATPSSNASAVVSRVSTDWRFWAGLSITGMVIVAGIAVSQRGKKRSKKRSK